MLMNESEAAWLMRIKPGSLHNDNLILWNTEPQLGIEIDVVIPGQPVDGIKLAVWQSHHLGETNRDVIDLVDQPLRCHDRHITEDLYRSVVDPGEALARALTCQHRGPSFAQKAFFLHSPTAKAFGFKTTNCPFVNIVTKRRVEYYLYGSTALFPHHCLAPGAQCGESLLESREYGFHLIDAFTLRADVARVGRDALSQSFHGMLRFLRKGSRQGFQ